MLRKRTIGLLAGATLAIALVPWQAQADNVILDDLIVDGSACIGFDCVNGESFGFDTLRLKENNLRLHFDDTSTTASFPQNDWRILANQTQNGGASFLAIEDSTAGRIPFTVEAGARANALWVDNTSRIGFGTSTPVADLHVKTGNTPTLRLEQDGSSGFAQQTWDVAGNEANFFIRDATNGSALPFRIRPGAPTSTIDIQGNGSIELLNASNQQVVLNSSDGAGQFSEFAFQRANVNTFSLGTDNQNFYIYTYDDQGTAGGARNIITVNRATGAITLAGDVTITGTCTGC